MDKNYRDKRIREMLGEIENVKKNIKDSNKIENSNYILNMLISEIRSGKLKDIEEVAQWCFEKIKINDILLK
jgi:hypothetical protein